ncbi:MAG TPA: TIGR00730 family Rossman fold protein [Candidatus Nanoarchaeia archaeon]|nr:TIGR00730 family Rossman fold protein [Candidatus Nanoarchaeia archaeon]
MKDVCVFCSASSAVDALYREEAYRVGVLLGQNNYDLIYGGTRNGLMGAVADGAHASGGKVVGIIPPVFSRFAAGEDEIVLARNLHERKELMERRTTAGFIALPGGFGTLDEIACIIALKQAQRIENPTAIQKPLVILNTNDFYTHLLTHFEHSFSQKFASHADRSLYCVAANPEEAIADITLHQPSRLHSLSFITIPN